MSNTPPNNVPGLVFQFSVLLREAKALQSMAGEFFDPSTGPVLERFQSNLDSIWSANSGVPRKLQLSGLRTIPSSFRGNKLYAEIGGTWELTPLGNSTSKARIRSQRKVVFSGIASTRIELYLVEKDHRIAMWRLELGAADSPGCYFHAQILGDSADPPFPESVEIPRLPSLFVTPMAAMDYVLGEVFGPKWEKAAETNAHDAPFWRTLQRERLSRLFKWCQETIDDKARTPWMALKAAKPEGGMFL